MHDTWFNPCSPISVHPVLFTLTHFSPANIIHFYCILSVVLQYKKQLYCVELYIMCFHCRVHVSSINSQWMQDTWWSEYNFFTFLYHRAAKSCGLPVSLQIWGLNNTTYGSKSACLQMQGIRFVTACFLFFKKLWPRNQYICLPNFPFAILKVIEKLTQIFGW